MTALSICSGIEAASVAWNPLGIRTIGVAEIEPFPCSVLAHHHPTVPNFGDLTKHHEWPELHPDILVGGTPCQAFSVAGLRKGLADPRGNLTLVFLGLVARQRPRWVVWENVPGVLSIDGGRTFGAFLGGLGQLGYGFSYRVLDAQFVRVESHARGVPQRRRRVFVVAHLGDWRRAAAVLFERESLRGDSPPRRESGKGTAQSIAGSLGVRGTRSHTKLDGHGAYVPETFAVRTAQTSANGHGVAEGVSHTLDRAQGQCVAIPEVVGCLSDGAHNGGGLTGRTPTRAESSLPPVAWALQERDSKGMDSDTKEGHLILMLQGGFFEDGVQVQWASGGGKLENRTAQALRSGAEHNYQFARIGMAVRRLTPRECERLQGFPDDYTLVPHRGKPAADGPRYKALGNSMAVNVMRWIGERILQVEKLP